MLKRHKTLTVLISTFITLGAIYGITNGKIIPESMNLKPVAHEEAAKAASASPSPIKSSNVMPVKADIEGQTQVQNNIQPQILTYTIKSGDTLESIAKTYGIKVGTITGSNGISVKSTLKIGQELEFPSIDGILYSVRKGEALWDIADEYNIDIDDIVGANGLDDAHMVSIGQKLILPGATKLKTQTASVKARQASVTPAVKSSLITSSTWPTRGILTSKFGTRWGRKHEGIDIAAPIGSEVIAFMGGTISFSGWRGSYGNLVIIDHGNGLETYYGHNSKLLLKAGQKVSKGDLIAKVGSTGRSTGPHSHFEVRKNGIPVDPMPYLKK